MRSRNVALALGLLAAAAAWRASFAGDPADEAFDSPAVKELGAQAEALSLDDEIALLKRLQRSMDKRLLTPADSAWKGHDDLRQRTDAGVARILERGRCTGIVSPREGGAYWSFTKRSNSYDDDPQIELQHGEFSSGFSGGNVGVVVKLPQKKLSDVVEGSAPDDLREDANAFHAKVRSKRRDAAKAENGAIYVVRAVGWDDYDVLAAFQVVSQDNYGATIAWKILKTYDVPKQKR